MKATHITSPAFQSANKPEECPCSLEFPGGVNLARFEAAVNDALTERPESRGIQIFQVCLQLLNARGVSQLVPAVKEFRDGVNCDHAVHRGVFHLYRAQYF